MDLWGKIASRRDGFGVRCGVRNRSFDSPEALAGEFGLRSTPNIYLEVDEQAAQAILRKLLHEDMAYQSELLPAADAAEIAGRDDNFRSCEHSSFSVKRIPVNVMRRLARQGHQLT